MKFRYRKFGVVLVCIIMILSAFNADAGERDELPTLFMRHFTWGVDAGSSIDVSGNDLSSLDMEAFFGYKNDIIQALGVGVGLHSALGNSNSMIPAFALCRVNLRSYKPLLFVETRIGYSFNSLNTAVKQDGVYSSVGIGFNLYMSKKVKSHIALLYSYSGLKADSSEGYVKYAHSLSAMSIRIGVSF